MSWTQTIDNAYQATQQHFGDPVTRCPHKKCGAEIDTDTEPCDECHEQFCIVHTRTGQYSGLNLCDTCADRQQGIIGSSVRSLEMVIQRAKSGKYLTDDEFRDAVEAWWEEL